MTPREPITLRNAQPAELDRIRALLADNDLPTEDIRANQNSFYVAEAGGDLVGIGGLELYHPHGLLRSLVVPDTVRSRGYGSLVLEELENLARQKEIDELYLLTTTAEGFFRRHEYRAIPRDQAPSTIKTTREFAELCPSSATVMQKSL